MGSNAAFSPMAFFAVVLSAIHGEAQQASGVGVQPRNDAGFMSIKRSFNATSLTVIPGIDCNGTEEACALTSAIFHQDRFWVLGREGWCCALNEDVGAKTFIHEWNADGTYLRTLEVPLPVDTDDERIRNSGAANTAPEVRDMASDTWRYVAGAQLWIPTGGEAVFFGTEEGIYVTRLSPNTAQWELWDQIERANGRATVAAGDFTNPIAGPGLDLLRAYGRSVPNAEGEGYMAVAYDPDGNGGQGSFWVGADDGIGTDGLLPLGDPRGFDDPRDPRSQRTAYAGLYGDTPTWDGFTGGNTKPILEIDLHGNVLTTLHNGVIDTDPGSPTFGTALGGEWVAGGLELDPLTGNLWVQMNMDQQLFELDTTTGDATGFTLDPVRMSPGRTGGIVGIPRGDPGEPASFFDLVAFTNAAGDDFFTVYRGHLYPSLDGLTEPRLKTSVNELPVAFRDVALPYSRGDTLNLLVDTEGQGSAAGSFVPPGLGVFLFDFNADTEVDVSTDFRPLGLPGVFPELRVHNFFSNPPGPFLEVHSVFTSVPYAIGLDFPISTGNKIRTQMVYFDPRSQYGPGLMVTNEAWFAGVAPREVLVELVGDSSMNAYVDGFFRIHYLGGPAIESVTIDLAASSSNADLADAFFDLDQPGLLDWMGVGRGWDPELNGGLGGLLNLPGCDGSWRMDSDLTTGMVYDAGQVTVQPASFICNHYHFDLNYELRSGFTSTTPGPHVTDMTFRFTDFDDVGDVLRFDCDTDGVVPDGAAGHYGMVVTITQAGGNVYTGELLLDPNGGRAFLGW